MKKSPTTIVNWSTTKSNRGIVDCGSRCHHLAGRLSLPATGSVGELTYRVGDLACRRDVHEAASCTDQPRSFSQSDAGARHHCGPAGAARAQVHAASHITMITRHSALCRLTAALTTHGPVQRRNEK